MTKQFKKGLVAVLVVLMAVLVGFTANAVIGASQADEKPNAVVLFEKQVELLPDLEDEQKNKEYLFTGIMGEEQADLEKAISIWNAYNAAKLQIPDLTSYQYIDQIETTLINRFAAYDAIFSNKTEGEVDAYGQLLRFTVTMNKIANKTDPYITYDASHELVEALGNDITTWEAGKDTEGSIYYYIYNSSSNYREYNRALKLMQEYEAKFAEVGKLVESIEYYDEIALTLKGSEDADIYDPASDSQTIVLDSETSINKVTEALETLNEADRKYITGADGEYNLDNYTQALDAYNNLFKSVDEVVLAIDNAYAAKEDKVTYYTVRDKIAEANELFEALKAQSKYEGGEETAANYNDLATKVTNADKLTEMLDYLKALDETTIPGVVTLIENIPALENASYTVEYRTAIEAAEEALEALDTDIKDHDAKVYEILKKRAVADYDETTDENKAADDEYLVSDDVYMPEGKDYIVEGYDKLMDSRAQHEVWTAYIRELINKVEELIDLQQNHEGDGVSALLGDLLEPYTNTGAPWKGADTTMHQNAFLYAATQEGETPVYIEDEVYGDKYDFMVVSPYPPRDNEDKVTVYEVLSYFYMLKGEIQTKVSSIETDITNLSNTIAAMEGKCVYSERDTLLNIWDEYEDLKNYVSESDPDGETINLQHWVSNYATLEAMYDEYVAEDALVKAWAEALTELDENPVSVAKFETIAKVEEAFKAIAHAGEATEATVDFGTFLAEEMENHGEIVLNYSVEYTKYAAVIEARDSLKKTIDDLAASMLEIETDETEGLLELSEVVEWTANVNEITDKYNAIADKVTDEEGNEVDNVDVENNIDYTGAQAYLQENYGAAYPNYLKALRLIERYEVEAAIEELPTAENVTLADKDKITKAWELHDAYLTKYHPSDITDEEALKNWIANESHVDYFRNDEKLHACLDKINEINQELNAWMRKVVALYEEIADDADLPTIEAALKNGESFVGYPLDLVAWDSVSEEYTELVGEDENKIAYVENAKTVLDGLKTKSDEVIADLNNRIKEISDKINGTETTEPQELTAEDIQKVSDIQELYNKLHETQQQKVEGYDDVLLDARDTLVAVESFKTMVDALYAEVVTNNNVTSYVQFYIDVVKTTYAQFTADIRLSFDDAENVNYMAPNGYTKNIEEIQAAYDAALEAGTVVRLSELKEAFDQAQAELIEALNGLSSLAETDASSALKEAFTNFENRITEAYTAAIEEKATALKNELTGLIDAEKAAREAGDTKLAEDLAAAKTELEGKITAAQTALNAAIEKEASDRTAALDAVNANINNIKTELEGKITEQITALETKLTGLIDAEKAAREAGDIAAADALKTAREALEASIEEAKAAIAKESSDRAAALANVITTANAAQAAVDQLREDMEKADAELKQQIDDLKSTTTTLTILVIVLAVMVLAALACIIILFIKRK